MFYFGQDYFRFSVYRGNQGDSSSSSGASNSRFICSFNLPVSTPPGDRLKPPPSSSTSGERKIIRLKSRSDSSSSSSDSAKVTSPGTVKTGVIRLKPTSSASESGSSKTSQTPDAHKSSNGSNSGTTLTKIMPQKEASQSKPIKLKRISLTSSTGPSLESSNTSQSNSSSTNNKLSHSAGDSGNIIKTSSSSAAKVGISKLFQIKTPIDCICTIIRICPLNTDTQTNTLNWYYDSYCSLLHSAKPSPYYRPLHTRNLTLTPTFDPDLDL